MKSFLLKVFMMFSAAFCLLEGLVLVAVGLGKLPADRLVIFYNALLSAPKALTTISVVGVFFVILGFILLILSSRTKPEPHEISVEKDGKVLNIPEKAVKDFILQIIDQNPCASDVTVSFERKEKGIEIEISASLDGVSSIYKELNEIEEVLKSELDRVFEWKAFTISFHLRGIGVDPKKKYFASSAPETAVGQQPVAEEKPEAAQEAVKSVIVDTGDEDDKPIDENLLARKSSKENPKGSSIFSRMLLGR
ncbi:MAG: hypothetical protein HQL21_07800 [Candidatus Omnitrophica bacterium]|nr:hypothetical protein [Candidatus Omnitrophota bacterium]